jgi:CheY-like chemotaxis protein
VLVVEDDEALRVALRDVLEEAGYSVTCVRDGFEALGVMRREPICFVLLDMHLPTMDGHEFRRRQLDEPVLAEVPIAVLTSDSRASLGDDVPVLWKPFDLDDLLRVVRACCSAGRTSLTPPARSSGGHS